MRQRFSLFLFSVLTLPVPVLAADTIPTFIDRFTNFIGNIFISFLLAIALVTFTYNVMRYFIIGSGDEQAREKAKRLALYSIAAFTMIVIMWGIVNFLVANLGFGTNVPLEPDYGPSGATVENGWELP